MLDFKPYTLYEIAEILLRLAAPQGLEIDCAAATILAGHCKGTPGNALALVKRIGSHYRSLTSGRITTEVTQPLLHLLGYSGTEDANITLADRLRTMKGLEFEQFVADLFGRIGYATELTANSGDHGIDILIRRADQRGAIQCKRWTDPVGEPVVRDFLGSMMGVGVNLGFIAITSTFTDQAKAFAHSHGIRLLDLDAVIQMATAADNLS